MQSVNCGVGDCHVVCNIFLRKHNHDTLLSRRYPSIYSDWAGIPLDAIHCMSSITTDPAFLPVSVNDDDGNDDNDCFD